MKHSNVQGLIHKSIKDKIIAKRDQVTSLKKIIFISSRLKMYVLEKSALASFLLMQDLKLV